jgi:Cell wall-active antibiotics response 4TMS YvqF
MERAYSARTLGDLVGLTKDLVTPADQPIRLDARWTVSGIFASEHRSGHWVVPEVLAVTAVFGEVVLDLTNALLQSQRVTIYATLIGGRLELIVPDGIAVQLVPAGTGGTGSGAARAARPQEAPAGVPVVEVRRVVPGGRIRVVTPRPPRRRGGRWPVSRRRRS